MKLKILNITIYFHCFQLMLSLNCNAQIQISINDAIELSYQYSIDYMRNEYETKTLEYRLISYKRDALPRIVFNLGLPNYINSITPITQPDGTDLFINRTTSNSSISLGISQPLLLTGGTLNINSSIGSIVNFSTGIEPSFSSNWFSLSYSQPLRRYNELKRTREMNLIKHKVDNINNIKQREQIHLNTIKIFFELYHAQSNYLITIENFRNLELFLEIAKNNYTHKRILESELLEIEINYLDFKLKLENAERYLLKKENEFKTYLNISQAESVVLIKPEFHYFGNVNYEKVFNLVIDNEFKNDSIISIMNSLNTIRRAKSEKGIGNASLSIGLGVNSGSNDFSEMWKNPQQRSVFGLGIEIPVLDWGEKKRKYELLVLNHKILEQEYISKRRTLSEIVQIFVMEINSFSNKVAIETKRLELSQKNLEIKKNLFFAGVVDVTDYNRARIEYEKSILNYNKILSESWEAYYELRKTTLFDFVNNQSIKQVY